MVSQSVGTDRCVCHQDQYSPILLQKVWHCGKGFYAKQSVFILFPCRPPSKLNNWEEMSGVAGIAFISMFAIILVVATSVVLACVHQSFLLPAQTCWRIAAISCNESYKQKRVVSVIQAWELPFPYCRFTIASPSCFVCTFHCPSSLVWWCGVMSV